MDISPDKQNVDALFSNTIYMIDFYQRDYKWNKEPVERLLEDIFFKFNLEYSSREKEGLSPSKEVVTTYYPWYYLNTYVTNQIEGKVYVVDGQQRLTTLTLILIKIYHLCGLKKSDLTSWVERKIVGYSGPKKEFWMNHVKHLETLESLLKDDTKLKDIPVNSGISASNMVENYKIISKWLDGELQTKEKFETFVFYFLYRLILINLNVEHTNVPMVFEVINDRGVKLRPFEILKGKLLGLINKIEIEKLSLNELWDSKVKIVNELDDAEDGGIDYFFWSLIRGKYVDSVASFDKVTLNNYHRKIFEDSLNDKLTLKNNPLAVKNFLANEFKYYVELYEKCLNYYFKWNEKFPHVYYNSLNEQNSFFMLIFSGCKLHDPNEEEKIKTLSYELDRMFSLLVLQKGYNSNRFNEIILEIVLKIRGLDSDKYRAIFDESIKNELSYQFEVQNLSESFNYAFFKDTSRKDLPQRFLRYFFARIEKYLADGMKLKMKHDLDDLVRKTGTLNGYHVEHILADNNENQNAFNNDLEKFHRERNRLGGLLLLKGKDNISSNNEVYNKKLKTYSNSLYWNESLREDSYKSKLDWLALIKKDKLKMRHMDTFGQKEIEERQFLISQIIQIIFK